MSNWQACPWEWDFHENVPWDGTARIAIPIGPKGQKLMCSELKIC